MDDAINTHETDAERQRPESTYDEFAVVLIGGGLGSFALADRLRIGGIAAEDICVVSTNLWPDESMAQTCEAIGMRPQDLLRSDSSSRIDNLWGFPSYAVSEAVKRRRLAPLLRVLGEPVVCEPYAPNLAIVRAAVRREAERIGWSGMVLRGRAEQIVANPEGGYLIRVQTPSGTRIVHGHHLHLALGSSGPKVPEETRAYRDQTGRTDRIVHAFEPHEHLYADLVRRGGDVLVRGAGTTSARVLQRLIDDRDASGQPVQIMQQFRDYKDTATHRGRSGVEAAWGFQHQTYDYPKAAYGGPISDDISALPEDERHQRIAELSFASTPYRSTWARQLRRGRTDGWYRAVAGQVAAFGPRHDGVRVVFALEDGRTHEASFDYVIDCTGGEAIASRHPLIGELLSRGLGSLNRLDGLRIDQDYTVLGADSGDGRIYASGSLVRGAAFAPVDSFLGLQESARRIADHLADRGIGKHLTASRSTAAWWRWVRGTAA